MRHLVVFDIMELHHPGATQRPASQISIGTIVRGVDIPRDTAAERAAEIVQACIMEETRRYAASSAKTPNRDLIYRHLERLE